MDGDAELELKRDWWQQVLAEDLSDGLPQLKVINWFEWRKVEAEVGSEVDWTVTHDPEILAAFQGAVPSYLRFASSTHC